MTIEEQARAQVAAPMAPHALRPTTKGESSLSDDGLSIRDPMAAHHDLLAALDRAFAGVEQLIAGVEADQWANPTPCTEWDVRQVVDHLISGNLNVAALVHDDPEPVRHSDQSAAGPIAAYRAAAATLRGAFAQPGVLDRTYDSQLGPAPGSLLVHLRIAELLAHGWDLARATAQPPSALPTDLAEQELALWRAQFEGGPGAGEGMPFAPAQPAAHEAPAIDRLAAFLGRQV